MTRIKALRHHWPLTTQGLNIYDLDRNLQKFLRRAAPDLDESGLRDFAAWVAGPLDAQARYTDRYAPPILSSPLAVPGVPGERCQKVIFNPLYEQAQAEAYRKGSIGAAYRAGGPGHLSSFIMGYMLSQSDISTHCPVTLTGAVAHVLNRYAPEDVREKYLPELIRMDGLAKTGGTWVTEKHSGTNAGATECTARKVEDGTYRLSGQKWFSSNASSNLALVLARPEGAPAGNKGAALYLVPDSIDGKPNSYHVTALKDKLGTRGLATAELDLNDCVAIEIAPPPHGLRIMMQALEYSRVHNAVAAAGICHRTYLEALCFTENRAPFGTPLIEKPMIQKKLIGMAVEWMASCALAFHSAECFSACEQKPASADDILWMRSVTAAAKWRTAESGVQSAKTLLELIGGNGYTDDFPAERLLRDAMVLPVWEGPEEVQALEIVKVILGPDLKRDYFSDRLDALCDNLPDSVADLRRPLSRELRGLKYELRLLREVAARKDQDTIELVAGDFLHKVSDLLALTLLSCEAARECGQDPGGIKHLAALHFHEKHFGDRQQIVFERSALHRQFNDLACFSRPGPACSHIPRPGPLSL